MQKLTAVPSHQTAVSSQLLPAGFDLGNSATKAVFGLHQILIPSYIDPIKTRLHDVPVAGFVEYVTGDRIALSGQQWLAGSSAYQHNPHGFLKVANEARGKVAYSLQLLLGALAYLPYRPQWELNLVCSVHHADALGDDITKSLQGSHVVRLNGNLNQTRVLINVLRVLDEGAGAVAHAGLTSGQSLVYDFGGGTIITSLFGEKGKLIERQVSPGGALTLIDAIARNPQFIKTEAAEGDRELIRRGIEDSSMHYGKGPGAWSFETIYREELKGWISTVLKSALAIGAPWAKSSDRIVAIGGGAQLPLVRDVLMAQNIQPLDESAWVNVRGLNKLAMLLLGGSR